MEQWTNRRCLSDTAESSTTGLPLSTPQTEASVPSCNNVSGALVPGVALNATVGDIAESQFIPILALPAVLPTPLNLERLITSIVTKSSYEFLGKRREIHVVLQVKMIGVKN